MEIKGAILIIGSLLWDPDQGNDKGARKKWRSTRLKMEDRIHVKAPIRYGRYSGSEPNRHFTMVFSTECKEPEKFGTAYVVPFKKETIRSFKGIENQARFLSKAEGKSDNKLCKGINDKWCTIGAILSPKFNKRLKLKFLTFWNDLLENDGGLKDIDEYKIGTEKSVLSEFGEIKIDWPKAIAKSDQKIIDDIDIVLATCTKPNINSYPSIDELRKDINADTRRYFLKNIENGITTFQDRKILLEET